MDRVRAHPRPSRVGAHAVECRLHVDRALAAGLDPAAGRLEQDREVAVHELGRFREQPAQPVVLVGDLFALVEHERHVEAGAVCDRGPRRGRASPRGRPSCRPSRGRAARRRRDAAPRCRSPARCRGGRRARCGARTRDGCGRRCSRRCGRSAAAAYRPAAGPRRRRPSTASVPLTDGISQSYSVSAEEVVGHETMPCSRRIALSCSLSCRSPSGEVAQDERARQPERAARELLHPSALHHDRARG